VPESPLGLIEITNNITLEMGAGHASAYASGRLGIDQHGPIGACRWM
jgi:hypothetical protein